MMVTVLRRLEGLLDEYPALLACIACGEVRPAYQRAFEAQGAVFMGKASAG